MQNYLRCVIYFCGVWYRPVHGPAEYSWPHPTHDESQETGVRRPRDTSSTTPGPGLHISRGHHSASKVQIIEIFFKFGKFSLFNDNFAHSQTIRMIWAERVREVITVRGRNNLHHGSRQEEVKRDMVISACSFSHRHVTWWSQPAWSGLSQSWQQL